MAFGIGVALAFCLFVCFSFCFYLLPYCSVIIVAMYLQIRGMINGDLAVARGGAHLGLIA
jgi:hypothetical protein